MKDPKHIMKTVLIKDLAPFSANETKTIEENRFNDYEKLVDEARTSNLKVIMP